ncbi:hypothetical protein DSO57_1005137 [Entomophthora muscae]|uniref:Uncharacterized protein n=1 Tax=Entomophthora muscae TaxID=34485 RepID=A0ACC2RYY4_9FUNG|nr:hypothetical protein DSO57_1005137 [Entomophthora muscae]
MDAKHQGQAGQTASSEAPSSSAPSGIPNFLLDLQHPSIEQNSKSENSLNDYPPEMRQIMQMQLPKDISQANIPSSNSTAASMSSVSSSSFIQPSLQAPLRPQQIGQSAPAFHPFRALGDRGALEANMLRNNGSFQSALQSIPGAFNYPQFKGHMNMPNLAQIPFPAHLRTSNRPLMNRTESMNNIYNHSIMATPTQAQLSAAGAVNPLNASTASQAARARARPPVRPRQPSLKSPAPTGPGAPITPRPQSANLHNIFKNLTPEARGHLMEMLPKLKTGELTWEEFTRRIKPHLGDQFPSFNQAFQAFQPPSQTQPMPQSYSNSSTGPSQLAPRPSSWPAQNLATKATPPQESTQASAPSHQAPQTPQPSSRTSQNDAKSSDAQATDFGLLTDVMGSVGVDLREESENILRGVHGASSGRGTGLNPNSAEGVETDFTAPTPLLDPVGLKMAISGIASKHDIQDVNSEVYGYISLAVEERLRDLVEQMISASIQRNHSQSSFPTPPLTDAGRPVYRVAVALDPKKQLQAFERVDRHLARSFQQRLEEGSQLDEDGEPRTKRTKSRRDPGSGLSSSVRNLSEDARKRNANQTTHMFTGGQRKSWMMASSVSTTPRVSSPLASTPPTTPAVEKSASKTPPPPANHVRHLPATSSNLVPKPNVTSGPSSPAPLSTSLPVEPKSTTNPSQFQKPPHPTLLNLPSRGAKSASPGASAPTGTSGSRFTQVRRTTPALFLPRMPYLCLNLTKQVGHTLHDQGF